MPLLALQDKPLILLAKLESHRWAPVVAGHQVGPGKVHLAEVPRTSPLINHERVLQEVADLEAMYLVVSEQTRPNL